MAVTETEGAGRGLSFAALAAHLKAWRADGGERALTQRAAGTAFLIRVVSAAIIYLTQVLLARWMGRFEFGIYVYVWAWVGFLGMLSPMGVAYSAQRFIPEYRTLRDEDRLRGFLLGSRWMCLALGTMAAALLTGAVLLLADKMAPYYFWPFIVAGLALPIYTVGAAQDTIARSFNWIELALVPGFIVHPLIIIATLATIHASHGPVTALYGLMTASAGLWAVILLQMWLLRGRLEAAVDPGKRRYEPTEWLQTALPIFLVDGFFILLTYVDILILQLFVGPADIALYYAATKTLALVSFIYFAVGAASAHRFAQYHVAGKKEQLASFVRDTVRWIFWPSLALGLALLVVGKPILRLFGAGFEEAYPLLFVLVVGLLARSAIGPSERLLNMVGRQSICAFVYACAFATNLALCLLLIPHFGLMGAASATATAIMVETILLFIVVKRQLGLHVFIFGGGKKA